MGRIGTGRLAMPPWTIEDATARFDALLDTCLATGPQMVTRDGAEVAVLVPIGAWRRAQQAGGPGLKALLLGPGPRGALAVPARGQRHRRKPYPG